MLTLRSNRLPANRSPIVPVFQASGSPLRLGSICRHAFRLPKKMPKEPPSGFAAAQSVRLLQSRLHGRTFPTGTLSNEPCRAALAFAKGLRRPFFGLIGSTWLTPTFGWGKECPGRFAALRFGMTPTDPFSGQATGALPDRRFRPPGLRLKNRRRPDLRPDFFPPG